MKRSEEKQHRARKPEHVRPSPEPAGAPAGQGVAKHPGEKVWSGEDLAALKEKAAKADEYYERLVRLKAEFENFKKRTRKEKAEWELHANQELMLHLLPIIDSFELGLESAKKTRDFDKLLEGLELALGGLFSVLGKLGLKEVEAAGRTFDPEYHQAVTVVDSDTHYDDMVVDEIRKGYLLHNKLLRPAMVTVARAKGRPLPGGKKGPGDAHQKKDGGQEG